MLLDQLQTLCMVVQLGSFSRAGEELHLTQPAVSAQVDALEKSYHTKIFDRTGKGVTLTEDGRILLGFAEQMLRLESETRQTLDDLHGLKRGSISLGATPVPGVYVMPRTLGRFKDRHPQVELTMRIDHFWILVERLLDKTVDLGIAGSGSSVDRHIIEVLPFMKEELLVITPPNHPLAHCAKIAPVDLVKYPFLAFGKRAGTRRMLEQSLAPLGIKLNIALVLGNTEAIKQGVEAGLGIAVVSQLAVKKEVERGWLKAIPIAGIDLSLEYALLWHKGKRMTKAMETFIEFCVGSSLSPQAEAMQAE